MNYAIVFRLLGYVLMIEGALLLLPAAASLSVWRVDGAGRVSAHSCGQRRHRLRPAHHQTPQ